MDPLRREVVPRAALTPSSFPTPVLPAVLGEETTSYVQRVTSANVPHGKPGWTMVAPDM